MAGITGPVYYGYRAWGPNWTFSSSWTKGSSVGFVSDVDAQGDRFNPNKLLIDPYAHEISHDPVNATWTDGTVYASGSQYRNTDSGNMPPKSILWMPASQSIGTKPTRAQKDDIIYEVNVRGLTKSDANVPTAVQGYLRRRRAQRRRILASLGITASGVSARSGNTERLKRQHSEFDVRTELLGLLDVKLLRARSPLCVEQSAGWPYQRVSVHGESFPRSRH